MNGDRWGCHPTIMVLAIVLGLFVSMSAFFLYQTFFA
jgi:hypothetical protein